MHTARGQVDWQGTGLGHSDVQIESEIKEMIYRVFQSIAISEGGINVKNGGTPCYSRRLLI